MVVSRTWTSAPPLHRTPSPFPLIVLRVMEATPPSVERTPAPANARFARNVHWSTESVPPLNIAWRVWLS
jgi:hypothetical protein